MNDSKGLDNPVEVEYRYRVVWPDGREKMYKSLEAASKTVYYQGGTLQTGRIEWTNVPL